MAITIEERPKGYSLDKTSKIITVAENYGGSVIIEVTAHGLIIEQPVYLETTVDNYNGFFLVEGVVSDNSFTIKEINGDGTRVPFISNATGIMYAGLFEGGHGFSCVHLPIVYELSNDLFPYSTQTSVFYITFYGFVNGYMAVTHTALTGADVLVAGDSVAIDNHGNIFEVVEIVSTTITALRWDGSFAGRSQVNTLDPSLTLFDVMQKYNNNYHIKVQIYGGLSNDHYWNSQKPYELLSTLKITPDEDNSIRFSISNELKKQIKSLTNNLTLATLPNNIDAFAQFYITTQESYDIGSGGEPTTFTGSIVSDKENFEGVAVNAKLPFKNIHSGYLSDYLISYYPVVLGRSINAKFLTLFARPTIFAGYYFDISAIIYGPLAVESNYTGLNIDWLDADDNVALSSQVAVPDTSLGVFRFSIEANCDYPRVSIYTVFLQDGPTPDTSERLVIDINCECANNGIQLTWLNYLGGMEYWVFTAFKENQVDIKGNTVREKNIFPSWPQSYGANANTIRQETSRKSANKKVVRSQYISVDNLEALKFIKTSSLVQIINGVNDLRTVLVDTDSFTTYQDGDKTFAISFTIEYTDFIPSQSL